jgi:hypothetical protein
MPSFSQKSMSALNTTHRDLQTVMLEAIKHVDFSVVFGHRSKAEQYELWQKGRNKRGDIIKLSEIVTYKDGHKNKSKHNYYPSKAVDIIPYPSGWRDEKQFYFVAGVVMTIARELFKAGKIENKIHWGGTWENFCDLPHFQI